MNPVVDPAIVAIFGKPPHGVDLSHEHNTLHSIVTCASLGLAGAAVALRLRICQQRGARLRSDDIAIVLSLIFTTFTVALSILAGQHGAGAHVWTNHLPSLVILFKVVYGEPFIYGLAVTVTKISILLFYHRLFYSKEDTKGFFFYLYWTAFALTVIYPVVIWVTMAVACHPISYWWTQWVGAAGYCINMKLFFLFLGIVNLMNDVVILIIPIPRIARLPLSRKSKSSVIGIMLLGSFVCIASVIRIYHLYQFLDQVDATWWIGSTMAWSSIEPSVAIISACLPTFAPLLKRRQSAVHGAILTLQTSSVQG